MNKRTSNIIMYDKECEQVESEADIKNTSKANSESMKTLQSCSTIRILLPIMRMKV